MLRLFIKESTQNNQRMTVRDDRGQIIYIIEGRWGRKNDVTSIHHLNGERILSAKQVKQSPLPVFELFTDGEEVANMRKHPGLFGIRDSYFTIHPFNWVVTGDFEDLYFTVHKDHELIMECEKDVYDQFAVYELYVEDEKHAPMCALIATLFDPYSRNKDNEENQEELSNRNYRFGFNHFSLTNAFTEGQYKVKTKTR